MKTFLGHLDNISSSDCMKFSFFFDFLMSEHSQDTVLPIYKSEWLLCCSQIQFRLSKALFFWPILQLLDKG